MRKISAGLRGTGWLLVLYGLISFCGLAVSFFLGALLSIRQAPMSESQYRTSVDLVTSVFMPLPNKFVAIGMLIGGIGVLRLKSWGRWLVVGAILTDFIQKSFWMYASSRFNLDFIFQTELTVFVFYSSLFLELLVLLYFMRPNVKIQFKQGTTGTEKGVVV